jgi:hypothetical protein
VVDASKLRPRCSVALGLIFRFTETQVSTIEAVFQEFTERSDIAILLINQHVSSASNTIKAQFTHQPFKRLQRRFGQLWIAISRPFLLCWKYPARIIHMVSTSQLTPHIPELNFPRPFEGFDPKPRAKTVRGYIIITRGLFRHFLPVLAIYNITHTPLTLHTMKYLS